MCSYNGMLSPILEVSACWKQESCRLGISMKFFKVELYIV